MTDPRTIRLAADDNVVVAVDAIAPKMAVAGTTARERVPRGHKMAVAAIAQGAAVRKYGQIIGFASRPIAAGDWVHEHNVALRDFARDYHFCEEAKNDEVLPPELRATFEGYVRPNGRTGTRNYIGVLTSVNCSASAAKFIAEAVNRSGTLPTIPASTAWSPSCTAPVAGWLPMAKAGRCCAAPSGATPRIPISAPP